MTRVDLTRRLRSLTLLASLAALSAACTDDPHAATQLVVEVDSDLPVPQTLARLQARVLDPESGNLASERRFQLTLDGANGTFALPLPVFWRRQGSEKPRAHRSAGLRHNR